MTQSIATGLHPSFGFAPLPLTVAASLLNGLVGWYELDESSGDAIDANGNYDLTEAGTVGSASGQVDGARNGFSSSDYFSSSDAAFSFTGTFYIAFWVNSPDVTTVQEIVSRWNTAGNQRSYTTQIINNDVLFQVSSDGTFSTGVTVETARIDDLLSANTWHFIEAFHDTEENVIGVAVDNSAFVKESWSNGVFNGTAQFRVGVRQSGDRVFLGAIDNLVILNRIPTNAERALLYGGARYPGGSSSAAPSSWSPSELPETVVQADFTDDSAWTLGVGANPSDPATIPNLVDPGLPLTAYAGSTRVAASFTGDSLALSGGARGGSDNHSAYQLSTTASVHAAVLVINLVATTDSIHTLFSLVATTDRNVNLHGDSASQNYAISFDGSTSQTGSFRINGAATTYGPGQNVAYTPGVNGRLPEGQWLIIYMEFTNPRDYDAFFVDLIPAAARGVSGSVRYLIALDSVPSANDRDRLEGYAAWETGLASALDASHPYKSGRP